MVGAILIDNSGEWITTRRYLSIETLGTVKGSTFQRTFCGSLPDR